MRRTGPRTAAAVLVGATVVLAGCGSSPSSGSAAPKGSAPAAGGTAAAGTARATIGVGTGTYSATLTTPVFAQQGLELTQQQVNSGAAAVPLLLNGQLQFTAADSVGALTAISKRVPLVIVGIASTGASTPATDATAVLVTPTSPIRSARDLAGKKVAVNGIGNASQLSAAASVDAAGGRSSDVQFVETPPPTMLAALKSGTVAAAVLGEPYISQGRAAGLRVVVSPVSTALPGAPLFVYITSQSYLAQHRDVVEKFARAMEEANGYAAAHPEFVRAFAVKSQKLSPADAAGLILPVFDPPTVQRAALQRVQDLMLKYKTIAAPVDLDKALFVP